MRIKNNIAKIAAERGMTPTELSRIIIVLADGSEDEPLSFPTVQNLAGGQAVEELPERTLLRTLILLAWALDCKVGDLFEAM